MKPIRLISVLVYMSITTVSCLASWPILTCKVGQLRREVDEVKSFPTILTNGAYIKGPRFTAIDTDYQDEKNLFTCSLTVGYGERKDWSALHHRDVVKPNWKVFPSDSVPDKGGELRNLTTLMATIDSLGLHARRTSCERVSIDGNETYGVWNRIEVDVKKNESVKIVKIVMAYMKSLDDTDEILCYGPDQ